MRLALDRPVARGIRLEHVLWVALVGATLVLRLLGVDKRPLHHDEAIHAWASWRIVTEGLGVYGYDPVYHGPVLYYLGALAQAGLGASDLSARLPAVVCGVGLVALGWALRPLVGRRVALVFALLLATSPALAYYGRSLRHDVPYACFLLGAVVAWLRHMHTGRPWLAYVAGALLGLAAATKEDVYLAGVVTVAVLLATLVVARDRTWVRRLVPSWWALATAVCVFCIVFLVCYTTLLRKPEYWNATWRAVDYWWGQHETARVGGPWWYYVPLLLLYEPLLLVATLATLVAWLWRGRPSPAETAMAAFALGMFAVYAWAQEKVPWLLVPMLVPMALVAAHHLARPTRARLVVWVPLGALTLWSTAASSYGLAPAAGAVHHEEPIAYVQTTGDVRGIVARLRAAPGGVMVSGQATWPLSWYLRGSTVHWDHVPPGPTPAMLVVDPQDAGHLGDALGPRWQATRFPLRGWWMVDWTQATPARVARFLALRRPWGPTGTSDAVLLAADPAAGPLPAVAVRVPPPARAYAVPPQPIGSPVLRTRGDGLRDARAVAAMPDGGAVVADTANHRLVRFDAHGGRVAVWGGPEAGDAPGRFREPCGVAAAPDGGVYVADTWNHRVQHLGPEGDVVAVWTTAAPMWGPRAVAVAPDGRVYVADTGNKRIVVFAPSGRELASFGRPGSGPGELVEPVGLAIDPEAGTLWVADTGNRRVQAFDLDGRPRAQWRVPGWEAFQTEPYLAWRDGLVWASDAPAGRVNGFDTTGALRRSLAVPGLPRGLDVARDGTLLVVQGADGRLLALPRPLVDVAAAH